LAAGDLVKRPLIGGALVVVIATALAWGPLHTRWLRHRKGEAYRELPRILAQQKMFKARLDEFLTLAPIGPRPGEPAQAWPATPCPAECRRIDIGACTSFGCLDYAPQGDPHYRYACRASRRGDAYDVSCAAAADLDADGQPSLLVIGTSTTGHLVAPLPELEVATGTCAQLGRIPSEVVFDCTPGTL
jgi:hypothetical protein